MSLYSNSRLLSRIPFPSDVLSYSQRFKMQIASFHQSSAARISLPICNSQFSIASHLGIISLLDAYGTICTRKLGHALLCNSDCPRIHSVAQNDLDLTEILLPQPPGSWDDGAEQLHLAIIFVIIILLDFLQLSINILIATFLQFLALYQHILQFCIYYCKKEMMYLIWICSSLHYLQQKYFRCIANFR